MRKYLFGIIFLFVTAIAAADTVNPDRPLYGDWDFNPELMWSVDRAGGGVFGRPTVMRAAADGRLYICDEGNRIFYILETNGRLIGSFGGRGEGPGEVRSPRGLFLAQDKVVVVDAGRIHFFNPQGEYLHSAVHNSYRFRPVYCLNENEFICFPLGLFEVPDLKARVTRYRLKEEKANTIYEYQIFDGSTGRAGGLVAALIINELTPAMTVGYGNDRVYLGMNNLYRISIFDLEGKNFGNFSVERAKRKLSDVEKKEIFSRAPRMRPAALKQVYDSTPNEVTFFSRIEVLNGWIYVFVTEAPLKNRIHIDIFSPGGRYCYRGFIGIDSEYHFLPLQDRLPLLAGGFLYAAVTDFDDEVRIVKYRLRMPPAPEEF